MYIIDSNLLIAELLSKYHKDESAKIYLQFYRKIPLMKRVVPDFIISEFELFMTNALPVRYLLHVNEKKQLHDVVSAYLRQISANCTLAAPNGLIMKTAFSLYQNQFNELNHISLTDCLLLAMAGQLQYTVITLDSQVKTLAAELHIPHFEPLK